MTEDPLAGKHTCHIHVWSLLWQCTLWPVTLTRRSVAVLAHMPNATVLMSHLMASIMSKMAIVAYGEPPALQHLLCICHPTAAKYGSFLAQSELTNNNSRHAHLVS